MSAPHPLTPAESDLQDFPFMPLHVARLRDSDLAAEESPEACWYALLLWSASWHQLPAGSLPDNEAVLTKLLGLGRDVRTFRKHRAGALRGFIKCSDGRLYHPVVAEVVLTSWEGKLRQRWQAECARIKKANQRNNTDLPSPTFEEFKAGQSVQVPEDSPEGVPGDMGKSPPGQTLQEIGIGIERIEETPKPPSGAFVQADFDLAWEAYPEEGRATTNREFSLAAWKPVAEEVGSAALLAAVRAFAASAVVKGPRPKSVPNFAMWLRKRRFEVFLAKPSAAAAWNGPADIWKSAVKALGGEAQAVSYLSRATWQEVPERAILAASVAAAEKLEGAGLGVKIIRPQTGKAA